MDDSAHIAHQTTVENLLVKITKNFKKELGCIRGVNNVSMDAHVRERRGPFPKNAVMSRNIFEPTKVKSMIKKKEKI